MRYYTHRQSLHLASPLFHKSPHLNLKVTASDMY